MVYHPSYYETRWKVLRDKAGPMRGSLKRASGLGLTLPPSPRDASKDSCPSYHIKGLCNSRCSRAGDHMSYPSGGDQALIAWATKVILGE